MKGKLLDNTIAKMSDSLTPAQLYELRRTLEQELSGYEIVVAPCQKERTKQANEELLGSFISAKRIEGCSEKTLNYYQNTISAWLVTINMELRKLLLTTYVVIFRNFRLKTIRAKQRLIISVVFSPVSSHGLKMRII